MDEASILELLKYGEHIHLECKKAESTIPVSVWETYSSFANTDGGVILLGVEEHLKETDFPRRFSFSSVHNPDQRIKDFWNTINNDKVSANILVDADVGTCMVMGALVLWICVPQADYKQRPVISMAIRRKGATSEITKGTTIAQRMRSRPCSVMPAIPGMTADCWSTIRWMTLTPTLFAPTA